MLQLRNGAAGRRQSATRAAALENLEARTMLCVDHALPSAEAMGFATAGDSVAHSRPAAPVRRAAASAASVMTDEVMASALPGLPALSSRPGAPKTLFLDFDGDVARRWGSFIGIGGLDTLGPIPAYDTDGDTATLSAHETVNILEIWGIVAEKFSPFEVNVTTVDPGHLNDNVACKVVIGGDGSWYNRDGRGGAGGVAYVGGFYNDNESLGYVWDGADNPDYVGEASAHEAGHMFGLYHQSSFTGATLNQEYRDGYIMGGGGRWGTGTSTRFRDGMVQVVGPQDDLHTLTTGGSRFTYRPDDHGNTRPGATVMSSPGGVFFGSGVITQTGDVDMFRFAVPASGHVRLETSVPGRGAMLDTTLQLFRPDGSLAATADTDAYEEQIILSGLPAGNYYAAVSSSGDYGSIGQYFLTADLTGPEDDSLRAATRLGRFGEVLSPPADTRFEGATLINGVLGGSDRNDFYKVAVHPNTRLTVELLNLTGNADLQLIQDGSPYGSIEPADIVAQSDNGGNANELVTDTNTSQTYGDSYYIRVTSPFGASANYTLRIRADGAGQLPPPGTPPLPPKRVPTVTRSYYDYVGPTDASDWYELNVGFSTNRLAAQLDGHTQNLALDVAHDANNDGVIGAGEVLASSDLFGTNVERITDLPVEDGKRYYVRVKNVGATESNYRLTLTPDFAPARSLIDLEDAARLGDLSPSQYAGRIGDYVGGLDESDIYHVQPIPGPIRIELKDGSAPHAFDLVSDLDGDRVADPNEILATGDVNKPIALNLPALHKNLYVRVHPGGANQPSDGPYELLVKTAFAESKAGLTVGDALLLPAVQQNIRGYVGIDPQGDLSRPHTLYSFTLDKAQRFTVSSPLDGILVGLSVWGDFNKNGALEPGERLAGSDIHGDGPEPSGGTGAPPADPVLLPIDVNLAAGTYFLRVAAPHAHNNQEFIGIDYHLQTDVGDPIDLTKPQVKSAKFHYDTRPHALVVEFSEDVGDSLRPSEELVVIAITGGKAPELLRGLYDRATNTAAFVFDGVLPDGRYVAKIAADTVTDRAGNPLDQDLEFEFFFMAGDHNHDGEVNFSDLVILAQNYNKDGTTFSTGDSNYDGKVGFEDLVLLAQKYNTKLPLPAVQQAEAAAPLTASSLGFASEEERRTLFNSTAPVRAAGRPLPKSKPVRGRGR